MSKFSVEADSISSKLLRFFLLLQIAAMVIVVGLSLSGLSFWALSISCLTLFAFPALLLWLYARYRELPLVREKRELLRLVRRFQKIVQAEGKTIQQTRKQREILSRTENDEIQQALTALHKEQLENDLAAHTDDALMPEHRLESTQLQVLPPEQLEAIRQKYQPLQDRNDAAERKSLISKQILEHELITFQPRLELLGAVTFPNYLSKSLASHGLIAVLLAFGLIATQVVSSVSATASSIVAFLPTATATPSPTLIPTLTPEPSDTPTPTFTTTPQSTATTTTVPSQTASVTAPATNIPSVTPPPSNTPIIPISGVQTNAICDPAYPGVCIPPAPPDLDCGEIPYNGFQVLPPDPHHFDRDADGVGCES